MQIKRDKFPINRITSERKRGRRLVKIIAATLLIPLSIVMLSAVGIYYYFSQDLPDLSLLKNYHPNITTKVYSDQGELIGEFYVERRIIVPITRIPKMLIEAFVAAEDSRFYEHRGINLPSVIRAFFKNIEAGRVVQGGSTITQQVTKYFLLSPERRFSRKIREAILAYRIENQLSKENILFLYLNQIYLGHGAYGVESAAQTYFDKHVEDLNLGECAILAGLPKAPNRYSPFTKPEIARKRQAYVLKQMLKDGYINTRQFNEALNATLHLDTKKNGQVLRAPYFAEHIRRYIEGKYGSDTLYKDGLQVYSTVNLSMQDAAERALESGLMDLEKRANYQELEQSIEVQGALICMDPHTGHIKAMVGGRDFGKTQFNRAIQAKRQAGSAFKPMIYAAALDSGYTPATIIIDSPIIYDDPIKEETWKPKNFERKFHGPITFREALAKSRNVVTVKILKDIGIDYAASYAKLLGITSQLNMDLTMALGSSSVSLLELTGAYGVFVAQGKRAKPIFITRVIDREGRTLEQNEPQVEEVISPQTAYLMTNLLKGVVENGTGWRAKVLHRPVGGKTGTSNNEVDAWFIGFTPNLIAGTWVGFDDHRNLGEHETGSGAAAPIWVQFMKEVLRDKPIRDFPVPDGIVFVKTDRKTGLLASPKSTSIIFESFEEGTAPTEDSNEAAQSRAADFFRLDTN
ncbi:MAG: PBP1A family penicillin-binding protein [Pseudomonadota bacterium]